MGGAERAERVGGLREVIGRLHMHPKRAVGKQTGEASPQDEMRLWEAAVQAIRTRLEDWNA